MTRRIVVECTETLQRQTNPLVHRRTTANNSCWLFEPPFLNIIALLLHRRILEVLISCIQAKQFGAGRVYHILCKNPLYSVNRGSWLLRLSNISIMKDVPNPSKCSLEPRLTPLCGASLPPSRQPLTNDNTHKLAMILDRLPSMPQVPTPPQKHANLQNTNPVKILAFKNWPAPHRNQPNPPLVRQRVCPSSIPTKSACGTKFTIFQTALPKRIWILLRSQRRGAITSLTTWSSHFQAIHISGRTTVMVVLAAQCSSHPRPSLSSEITKL